MATEIVQSSNVDFLKAEIARLRQQVATLSRCRTFDILTREALEQTWEQQKIQFSDHAVIFLDVDNLKALNTELGYETANQMIRDAFNCIRQSGSRECEIVGRWFSGDEFVLIVPAIAVEKISRRVQSSFAQNGLSVTMAAIICQSENLAENVGFCSNAVQQLKSDQQRGSAVFLRD